MPPKPEDLDERASRAWDVFAPKLHECGILTEIDALALQALCEAWSRYQEATDNLKRGPRLIKAPKTGFPLLSPYYTMQKQALSEFTKLCAEFGMTPASRSRIEVDKRQAAPGDPMAEMLDG